MKTKLIAASLIALASASSFAQTSGDGPWTVFVRAAHLSPANDSSGLGGNNAIHVESKTIPDISVRYSFTKNIAAELLLTVPQKHEVTLNGTDIGSFKHLPPTLFAQYHFDPISKFSPYVGLGINYTRISDVKLAGGAAKLDNDSWGGAAQIGVDYKITPNLYLSLDAKKIYIQSDVKIAGAKVATVKVDPTLVAFGVGYRF